MKKSIYKHKVKVDEKTGIKNVVPYTPFSIVADIYRALEEGKVVETYSSFKVRGQWKINKNEDKLYTRMLNESLTGDEWSEWVKHDSSVLIWPGEIFVLEPD